MKVNGTWTYKTIIKTEELLRTGFEINEKDFILLFVGKFVKNRDIPLLFFLIKK